MPRRFILAAVLVTAAFSGYSQDLSVNRPGLSVRETFGLYTQAILKSDLEALFTTVSDGDSFFFVTPQGTLINSRAGYRKFHEDWFREKDWTTSFELLAATEGKDYGFSHAIFRYSGKTPDNRETLLESYFTLIFRREGKMWKAVADLCSPSKRSFKDPGSALAYSPEEEFFFRVLRERRTVRKFKPDPIPREHLLKILDAARFAPTAGNQQPWLFLVVQDRARLDGLKEFTLNWVTDIFRASKKPSESELRNFRIKMGGGLEEVLSAPVYVAVLADSRAKYPDFILYDGTLAVGNLMNAARALGYGTGFYTSYFPEDKMRAFFQIPDHLRLICFTPLGIPESWPVVPDKKSLDGLVVFETFQGDGDKKGPGNPKR